MKAVWAVDHKVEAASAVDHEGGEGVPKLLQIASSKGDVEEPVASEVPVTLRLLEINLHLQVSQATSQQAGTRVCTMKDQPGFNLHRIFRRAILHDSQVTLHSLQARTQHNPTMGGLHILLGTARLYNAYRMSKWPVLYMRFEG